MGLNPIPTITANSRAAVSCGKIVSEPRRHWRPGRERRPDAPVALLDQRARLLDALLGEADGLALLEDVVHDVEGGHHRDAALLEEPDPLFVHQRRVLHRVHPGAKRGV